MQVLIHLFFLRESNYMMVHGSFGWIGILEHAGEHYRQLVVYYCVNGLIQPEKIVGSAIRTLHALSRRGYRT
jgi:hypothetical protein